MNMKCPTCGKDCLLPAEVVLENLYSMYMACDRCMPDQNFNKNLPFHERVDKNTGRCDKCGKRHLDYVIANVLTILKDEGLFPQDATLREVGTPLIVFGYQIPYPPRLGNNTLILLMDSITEQLANTIVSEVPEIKGVIKRRGSISQSVGILDTNATPHTYELLSGCDMRCDVVSSCMGELCIYKNQSKIHVEFYNTKIKKIETMYLKGEFDNKVIVDALCGPGTLGLLCALGGAKKVILNDAWLPAVKNAILSIKMNSKILGVEMEFEDNDDILIGNQPHLMAVAKGMTEIMVYHGDIRKLSEEVKKCDICLLDCFPAVDASEFMLHCREISRKVVVI